MTKTIFWDDLIMKKGILLYVLTTILSTSVFSQSLLSADYYWDADAFPDIEWTNANNWGGNTLPNTIDDVFINNNYSATIFSGSNINVESLALGADNDTGTPPHPNLVPPTMILETSGHLTIENGANLTTKKGTHEGSDCVRLEGVSGNESSLIVNGTFNVLADANGDGIDVGNYTSVTVGSTGELNITASGKSGINLKDDLTNSGEINIDATATGDDGIKFSGAVAGSKVINNSGATITIDGGGYLTYGIELNSAFTFDNYGTVTISGTTGNILEGGMVFNNYGTLAGDGKVNPSTFNATGSTIDPGTPTAPIGKITFERSVNLSNIDLNIEINGTSSYDQLEVGLIGSMNITDAILNLSGSYIPMVGDEFMIINNTSGTPITGTFFGIPQGGSVNFNGVDLIINYNAGDGNDIGFTVDAPLPVELLDFNAFASGNHIKLSWITGSEINNDFFTIERSTDGRTFEKVSTINGNGNTSTISKYSFIDQNPFRGINYYRLKQTDFDGQFSFSNIETVDFQIDNEITIYPTLVRDEINIETNLISRGAFNATIVDLNGKILKKVNLNKNLNRTKLILSELEAGFYFLIIQNDNLIKTQKFIKQ